MAENEWRYLYLVFCLGAALATILIEVWRMTPREQRERSCYLLGFWWGLSVAMIVATMVIVLCLIHPARAQSTEQDCSGQGCLSWSGDPRSLRATKLTIGYGGSTIMIFDFQTRTITVAKDVKVDEAARRMIKALETYLPKCTGQK
jgi:hypothetical protein